MKYILTLLYCLLILSCQESDEGIDLLEDVSMSHLIKRGGDAEFNLADGILTGTAKLNTHNTFLCTKENYDDFILDFKVKVDSRLNSGVQIRSESMHYEGKEVIKGYQVEIDPSSRTWSGGIYEESGRGWINNLANNNEGRQAFKNENWNAYHIEAIGKKIRVWVNGINTANLIDSLSSSGLIGFQVHSIDDEKLIGTQVQWKDIHLYTSDLESKRWEIKPSNPETNLLPNQLSEKEKKDGWTLINKDDEYCQDFSSLDEFFLPNSNDVLEIKFEYALNKGSLGRLKYGVNHINHEEINYSIADDVHLDERLPGHRKAGSLTNRQEAKNLSNFGKSKALRFYDQWSQVRIKIEKDKIEHWLNDNLVVDYDVTDFKSIPVIQLEVEKGEICLRSFKVRKA